MVGPGLSPRVRGNREPEGEAPPAKRSIPARAGEPCKRRPTATLSGVYPRACGGTGLSVPAAEHATGLSPRVRGNRYHAWHLEASGRSIPARAGEPIIMNDLSAFAKVYPRACGGTRRNLSAFVSRPGLSPRVRGNRLAQRCRHACQGSIPARAGEPRSGLRCRPATRVYPRACGGTAAMLYKPIWMVGLSPRVRGNRCAGMLFTLLVRSIPARAGEPSNNPAFDPDAAVYPRACGGTCVN